MSRFYIQSRKEIIANEYQKKPKFDIRNKCLHEQKINLKLCNKIELQIKIKQNYVYIFSKNQKNFNIAVEIIPQNKN